MNSTRVTKNENKTGSYPQFKPFHSLPTTQQELRKPITIQKTWKKYQTLLISIDKKTVDRISEKNIT